MKKRRKTKQFNQNTCKLLLPHNAIKHCFFKLFRWTIPSNTPRLLHVETTWKRSFPRRLNAECTWCVYRSMYNHFCTRHEHFNVPPCNSFCEVLSCSRNNLVVASVEDWKQRRIQNLVEYPSWSYISGGATS